jgi:putative ABC transport system permease protein
MKVILKIALRNIWEHKAKSFIIGGIVALGIVVLVVGNALLDTAKSGMERSFTRNYTGDLMVTGRSSSALSIFGIMGPGMGQAVVPLIPSYFELADFVTRHPGVAAVNPQATGRASLSVDGNDKAVGFTQLFGVEPDKYRSTFGDNLEITAGGFLAPGEEGILLSDNAATMLMNSGGLQVHPGDKLLLTGLGGGGVAIRELTVRGIFHFKEAPSPQLELVSIVDIQDLRALLGYTVGAEQEKAAAAGETALAQTSDENALFGGSGGSPEVVTTAPVARGARDLLHVLGDTSERNRLSRADTGAWQFLLVRAKPGANPAAIARDIGAFAKTKNIDVKVSDWQQGAGPVASMASTLKNVFDLVILIIAAVAVIIIMNTLVISISERIAEIGTMRALGAKKRFVRSMITWETIMIAGVFGAAGLGVGAAVIGILNATGIRSTSMFLRILFGGEVLRPVLTLSIAVTAFVVIVLIGAVSSLYPATVALRIRPVRAMQAE